MWPWRFPSQEAAVRFKAMLSSLKQEKQNGVCERQIWGIRCPLRPRNQRQACTGHLQRLENSVWYEVQNPQREVACQLQVWCDQESHHGKRPFLPMSELFPFWFWLYFLAVPPLIVQRARRLLGLQPTSFQVRAAQHSIPSQELLHGVWGSHAQRGPGFPACLALCRRLTGESTSLGGEGRSYF